MSGLVSIAFARALSALVVAFGVASLVFALLHLVPGDPVDAMLGEYASAADRGALRRALGLDQPLAAQWAAYLGGVARGDLGRSIVTGEPVAALLVQHYGYTVVLALAAFVVASAVGLPLGILAAVRRHSRWDRLSSALAVTAMAVPNFVLGPLLLLLFAVLLGWLPIGGADRASAIVLPAVTLGLSLAALLARMTRAALIDVLAEPFVQAARARGLDEAQVIARHALRNAALPILTTLGLQLGALLGGAVITEVVFGWPGIGQLVVDSIHRRDYPVVQGCVLFIALSYVFVNMLTDIAYALSDPRLRRQP